MISLLTCLVRGLVERGGAVRLAALLLLAGALPAQLVCAHRGASHEHPENTLRAIREAVLAGADAVEVDVRATADGQLVLMHDATLDRTTDGRGPLARLRLVEVRRLDAGDGERVPTLLEAARSVPRDVTLVLDLKEPGLEARSRAILRVAGRSATVGFPADWISKCTNDPATALRLARDGWRCILTDRPDRMRRLLRR